MDPRTSTLERAAATALLGLLLAYVATERTSEPWILGWSKPWVALLLACIGLAVVTLGSYRRGLPGWLSATRRTLVASAAAIVLLLVVTETVLRAADKPAYEELDNSGRHAADPDVGHVYVPNHRQVLQTREYRVEWASNAQGVRSDRDFGPKAAEVTRILCVGDSFTACDQVPGAQSWPAALEANLARRLAESGSTRRIEVVNAGFPGFSTANEAAWLAKFGARFEPDLVLVATTPNDLSENPFPLQYTARGGRLVSARATQDDEARFEHRRRWWCLGGAIERSRLAQRIVASAAWARLRGRPPFHHIEAYEALPSPKAQRLYELADRCMLEARAASEALGARFGIVVIPYARQLREFEAGLDGGAYGAHWRDFAARHGLACVDTRERFLAHADPASLYWREDNHCTAAGYALVAEAAAELVWSRRVELGWTP